MVRKPAAQAAAHANADVSPATDNMSAEQALFSGPGPSKSAEVKPGASQQDFASQTLIIPPLPPVTWQNFYKEIRWFNLGVVVLTPILALYGLWTTKLQTPTVLFSVAYYVFNMIGECSNAACEFIIFIFIPGA